MKNLKKDKQFNFSKHVEDELFNFWTNLGESFVQSHLWDKQGPLSALLMSRLALDMTNDTLLFAINIFMDELLGESDSKSELTNRSKKLAASYHVISVVKLLKT